MKIAIFLALILLSLIPIHVYALDENAVTNWLTKLTVWKNKGYVTQNEIDDAMNYLIAKGYIDNITYMATKVIVSHSPQVLDGIPTFTTEINSCSHVNYTNTVYVEGFIKNNSQNQQHVIFKFETVDKSGNILTSVNSDVHQMQPGDQWAGGETLGYDPNFDHCQVDVIPSS